MKERKTIESPNPFEEVENTSEMQTSQHADVAQTQKMGRLQSPIQETIKIKKIPTPETPKIPKEVDWGGEKKKDDGRRVVMGLEELGPEIATEKKRIEIRLRLKQFPVNSTVHIPSDPKRLFTKRQDGSYDHYFGTSAFGAMKEEDLVKVLEKVENWYGKGPIGKPTAEEMRKKQLPNVDAVPVGGQIVLYGKVYERIEGNYFVPIKAEKQKNESSTINMEAISLEEMKWMVQSAHVEKVESREKKKEEPDIIKESSDTKKIRLDFLRDIEHFYPQKSFFARVAKWSGLRSAGDKYGLPWEQIINRIRTSTIKQGRVGDCYLLAGINSLKRNAPELYLDTISRNIVHDAEKKTYRVRFPGITLQEGLTDNGWITITEQQVKEWQKKGMKGDLADIVLERAYASAVSRSKSGKRGGTMVELDGDLPVEGGLGHRALYHLLSKDIARKFAIGRYGSDGDESLAKNQNKKTSTLAFFDLYEKNQGKYLVNASSPHADEQGQERKDDKKYKVGEHSFYYRHQYSVVGIEDGKVLVENPHDTSKRMKLTKEEFMQAFSQIVYAEIVGKYTLKE